MPEVVLFVFYLIIFSLILTRLLIRSQAGIPPGLGIFLFSFKVALGCCYGYIFLKYYGGDDPWKFYLDSLLEYQRLIHQPLDFFKDFLPGPSFAAAPNFSHGWEKYIQEMEYLLMVKFLAICDLFSGKNYYVDILFFDFLVFWGPFLLFKSLFSIFPGKKNILLICLFLIPSITFWLSGIRAEGLLLLFLGLIIYNTHQWLKDRQFSQLLCVLLGFAGFLIFRGQFLLTFLPAFTGWLMSYKKPRRAGYYFAGLYLACIAIFFASLLISKDENLSLPLIRRQKEFLELHGNTRLPLDTLQGTASSFIKTFPQAFANSLARPLIWEANGPLQWVTALGITGFWLLVGMLLICPEREWKKILMHPLVLVFLCYGLSQILLIGYVVPFPGAIVRYKAIPELFLIIALAIAVNWKKLFKLK